MPEERLGGSFSIDITNLRAGLQEANRLIRQNESEFRASAAGLDNWNKSEEGLTKRQQSLNTQIDIQKTKIAALIKEKENVIRKMKEEGKSQEDIDKAIDGVNKQITAESKQLDKLKGELNKTNKALDDLSDESNNAGNALKKAADIADKASGGFTVMKGALANLVADGFRSAINAAKDFAKSMVQTAAEVKASNSQFEQAFGDLESEAANSISNIAKQTGILETRLQSTGAGIYSFARSSGATTAEAMELMQEALVATADSAAYYDRSLEDSAETLQSFLKGNFANDAALGVSATEFTRNAKATELFGKKYNDLSEIEKQKTLLKMVTDSQKLSGAMGQASRESDGFENVMGNVNETYKQFQAKVGTPVLQSLIPVIQNATKKFQGFEKSINWDKFNKKATTTLNNIINTGTKLAKNTLPTIKTGLKVTGTVVKFVAENFKTLSTVTLTAVTVFKAFSATMKVTTAITAAKTAIAGLTAGVGIATKAQAVWNATMSANPIGAVITAVALLAGGIALLVKSQKDATEETDLLSEEQREAVTVAEQAAEAYRDTKKAADELASAEIANIDYTKTLWGELQTLADENGKVKEGYEGRAQFILNELNNALGTEYTMNGNVIQSYKDIKKSIDDVIQSKKAQILLEAYEESYREAVKNVADAEKERATQAQALAKQQDKYSEALKTYSDYEKEYNEKTANAKTESDYRKLASDAAYLRKLEENKDKEKNKLDEVSGKYAETENTLYGYYGDIGMYEQASTLLLEGETNKAIELLSNYGNGFKTVASTAKEGADKQKKILQQQVIDTEVNAQLMEQAYKDGVEGVTEEMVKTAKEQADKAKQEFKDVGGNITKGIAKGAEDEEWTLTGTMKSLINKALAAARKAADEHSPSKLFEKKVGVGLSQGIAVGVEKSTSTVVKSMTKQIDVMARTLTDSAKKGKFSIAADTALNSFSAKIEKGQTKITRAFENTVNNVVSKAKAEDEKHKSDYEKLGKNLIDSFSSGINSETSKAVEETKTAISKIASVAQDEYNNIQSKISSMQKSLMSYDDIFSFDKGNHNDVYAFSKNIKQQNKDLKNFEKDLEALKEKGVSKELLDYVASLNTENGIAAANSLLAMSEKKLQSFDKQYNQKLKLSKKISKEYYADDLKAVEDNFTDKVEKEVSKLKKKFNNIGKNSVEGFIDGLKSKNSSLEKSLKEFSKTIIAQLKKDFKIHSPSRVTRDLIGINLGKGVAVGVDRSTSAVLRSVKNQVKKVQNAYDFSGLSGSLENGINSSAKDKSENQTPNVTVNQYNTYSQAHSRYEIYKSKQQTAAAVRLAMGTV